MKFKLDHFGECGPVWHGKYRCDGNLRGPNKEGKMEKREIWCYRFGDKLRFYAPLMNQSEMYMGGYLMFELPLDRTFCRCEEKKKKRRGR